MAGKIAIVEAGLIGRSWAIVFARGGHEVALYDADAGQTARAVEAIAASLAARRLSTEARRASSVCGLLAARDRR